MGATDRTALDRLVRDFGADVKVNYETRSHAPARQGLAVPPPTRPRHRLRRLAPTSAGPPCSTVSSGTSGSPAPHTPELLDKFEATFDSYWVDPSFVTYDPDTDAERLDEALADRGRTPDRRPRDLHGVRARGAALPAPAGDPRPAPGRAGGPRPPPQPRRRRHRHRQDRHRRLDYRACDATGATRPCSSSPTARRSSSSRCGPTARSSADAAFGELYVGGAAAGALAARVRQRAEPVAPTAWHRLPADQFDVVVVDEFHHAEAATYRRLLDHLAPARAARPDGDPRAGRRRRRPELLRRPHRRRAAALGRARGGPAVPVPLLRRSDADRPLAARVAPRRLRRRRARAACYTADDARVRVVLRQLRDKVLDVQQHAGAGLLRVRRATPSSWPTGSTPPASRRSPSPAQTPREDRARGPAGAARAAR